MNNPPINFKMRTIGTAGNKIHKQTTTNLKQQKL